MKKLEYKVSFNTPAFLGNAEQQAQWRTPPFKALLRQWWRVVKAPKLEPPFDVICLRSTENAMFGTASDDGDVPSHRSRVRLRLGHWKEGDYHNLEDAGRVCHPEVVMVICSTPRPVPGPNTAIFPLVLAVPSPI